MNSNDAWNIYCGTFRELFPNARTVELSPVALQEFFKNAQASQPEAEALLRAVKVSEFSGISCQDVNGRNWFDARDAYLSGAQR
ncbi:MAG: hypothetical protein ACYC2K_07390 [Gemmatimonadales bacterium]